MHEKTARWSPLSPADLARALRTDLFRGLSFEEAEKRRADFGSNVLSAARDVGLSGRILKQFGSPLVYVLLFAGGGALFLGEVLDAAVIFIALAVNVAVGTVQEERASRAFEKLAASQERLATVVRGGKTSVIPAADLVPGDLVLLEAGALVPADVRLIAAKNLLVDESALTGEWAAVGKEARPVRAEAPLVDQANRAWMGTLVVAGSGRGVVTETGAGTEIGMIAESIRGAGIAEATPLRRGIERIARFLLLAIGAALIAIFLLGVLRGESFGEMLLVAIAVGVAAIPSGLPAAITVVLAIGMESILRRGGLVRNLLAAETLGATTVILTDKTGTLTEARMSLERVVPVESLRSGPGGERRRAEEEALACGILASGAFLDEAATERGEAGAVRGRPMERAILVAGLKRGITPAGLERAGRERIDYLSFDSGRRFGAALVRTPGKSVNEVVVAGAPETLLAASIRARIAGRRELLSEEVRRLFREESEREASRGGRLLAVASREVPWETLPDGSPAREDREILKGLTLEALFVFHDPIRPDVRESIAAVRGAGARVLMLTGDNPETARAVASAVGIASPDSPALLGEEIEKLSDEDLARKLESGPVLARVLPAEKLRIARILKDRGEVVAMTGDGVNDAPALRAASIGVAVGSGTDVAKEASDLVLLSNSFSVIVAAIEEGRKIIDNLKKIVAYLLSTSMSEIVVIGGALAAGAPLPLLPSQILWANLVGEGFMSFAFAFERGEPGAMRRDPRSHEARNVLTRELKRLIAIVSAVTGTLLLGLFAFLLSLGLPIEKIRTIMFVALSLSSIFFALSFKSFRDPLARIALSSNPYLLVAMGASVAILLAALALPPLAHLLSLTSLSAADIGLLALMGALNLATIEVAKRVVFRGRAA